MLQSIHLTQEGKSHNHHDRYSQKRIHFHKNKLPTQNERAKKEGNAITNASSLAFDDNY